MEAIWHLYWRVLSRMQQVGFPGERNFEMAVSVLSQADKLAPGEDQWREWLLSAFEDIIFWHFVPE